MAGCESHASNPLLADFIFVGQKLEQLGFTCYRKGCVVIGDNYEKPYSSNKENSDSFMIK